MAEIVEYRVEKTLDELNLLVDFGLFSKELAKEIVSKRQNFEYTLRRRNRTKLDYLKYIKFEVNLLNAIDNYRRTIIKNYHKIKTKDNLDRIDHKLLLLQARKLNDVVRSRCAHISSLFRKLTTNFQFDSKLWLAYIDFAKSRYWNTRVTALYWRLLRVSGHDEKIWLAAAQHETEANKAYDTARGLYLRSLRHHPKSPTIWSEYFKMELHFMDIVGKRASIVFKSNRKETKKADTEEDIWADDPLGEEDELENNIPDKDAGHSVEPVPTVQPIEKDDKIVTGHLVRIVYENAMIALDKPELCLKFLSIISDHLRESESESPGFASIKEFVTTDLQKKIEQGDARINQELLLALNSGESFDKLKNQINDGTSSSPSKRLKAQANTTRMELLYECYESEGIDATRSLFKKLESSVKNQTLSLYVGMIQVEQWQLRKDTSEAQLERIRSVFEKAISKFGKIKPKLWYEYLQFESDHSKSLDDVERMNRIYARAQATLVQSKVDQVVERYTILQTKTSNNDIEFSDYSDLED